MSCKLETVLLTTDRELPFQPHNFVMLFGIEGYIPNRDGIFHTKIAIHTRVF